MDAHTTGKQTNPDFAVSTCGRQASFHHALGSGFHYAASLGPVG